MPTPSPTSPIRRLIPAAIALGLLLLLGFAQCAFAQANPLNFGDNFFVTGDYVVAGAYGMNLTYSGGFTAGIIGIPDLNPGIRGTTTVPKGADIVAAFLYWQTVENSSVMPGQPGSGQNGFFGPVFNPLSNKSPHLYPITGVNLSSQAATPFSNGACSGAPPGKVVRAYRAEVRAFLPQDAQGNVLVDWPDGVTFAVRLPSVDDSTPYTLGATLVIIYRVLSPNFPLNSIVIYDGDFAPSSNTSLTMTQPVQGFYQAANNPVTRLTNIVGAGKLNKFQTASLGGGENGIQRPPEALPSPYGPGLPAFPGWYGNWDNTTWTFPDPEFPNLANPFHENDDSATATVVASGGHPGCVSWGVVIVSTRVKSSDGDGLLDVWKNNPKSPGRPGYCDASFNGGVCNVGDPSWVDLPGAKPNEKDVFVQLDYMCSNPTGPDVCDTSTKAADSLSAASPGSGAISASGGYTIYTLTAGTMCSPPFSVVGTAITIAGFANAANNGQFTVASCIGTQLVVNNAKGVAEINPGTATFTNYSFDPRQVLDPGTGTGSFDEVATAYANKGITLHPEWHSMPETPGCTDTVVNGVPSYCPYLYQPGLVGWKDGFESLKGQPLNYLDESSCETQTPPGGRPGTGPVCTRRFQHGRKDSYHEVIFAHAQGEPEWSLQGGSLTSVVAAGNTVTFTTSTPHGLVSASGMNDQNPLSRVTVSDAISDTMLSGTYLVQTTPTPTSFTIQITTATNATFTVVTDPGLSVTSGRVHTRSGFSDVGGADSLVTLGLWDPQLAQQVTGTTLMHEFGHANGLTHGGFYYDKLTPANNDYRPTLEDNCKPNFQSVMTYPFQLAHLDNGASLVVDYSEEQLDPLNEGNLLAGVTINGHAPFYPITKWYTPKPPLVGSPAKTFCDGTPVPQGTMMYLVGGPADPIGGSAFIQQLLTPPWVSGTDVNFDGTDNPPDAPPNGQMRGHSDWTNVVAANGLVISPGIDLRQVGATGADAFGSGGSMGPGGGTLGPGGGSRGPGGGSRGPGGGSRGPGGGALGPGGGSRGPGGGSRGPGGGVGEADVPTATGVTYAPSDLTATEAASPRKVTLNWTPAFGLIGAYNVYRSADGGNTFTRIAIVAGNPPATTYIDTVQGNGPPCNPTGYQYVVTAVQSSSSPNPNQESAPSNVVSVGSDGLETGCYIVTGPSLSTASAVHGSVVTITWTLNDDFNSKNFAVSNPAANTLVANGPLPNNCGNIGPTTILASGQPQSGASTLTVSAGQFTFNWDTDGFCAGQYFVTLNLDSGQSQMSSLLQLGIDVNDFDTTPHVNMLALTAGTVGLLYSNTLTEDGGTLPVKWTFTGNFPNGIMQQAPNSPTISGTTCTAGSYNFTATVTDSNPKSNSSTQPLTLQINMANTTTGVMSNANPSVFGQMVTFTVTVAPNSPCIPQGTITLSDGGTAIGSVALSGGMAMFTTSSLSAGMHNITAIYGGDFNFNASNSAILVQTVYPTAPTGLYASTITSTTVNLAWNASTTSNVTSYNVYRSLSSSGPFTAPIATGVAGTSFSDSSVVTSTIYYYAVTTVAGGLESTDSNIARVPFGFVYEQLQPPTSPSPRCCAAMADPGNFTVLFGGTVPGQNYVQVNDTWELQGGQWTQLSPGSAPPARSGAAMVFFPPAGKIVLFGGRFGGTTPTGDYNDTWTFDESTSTWTQVIANAVAGSPPGRRFDSQGIAYDPNTQTIVMFGGISFDNSTFFDDTWVLAFNQGTWTWTQQAPTTSPSPRRTVLATDPSGNVLLFGGTGPNPPGNLGDTWLWSGTTWQRQFPAASPGPRDLHNMDFDPDLGVVVLFGGSNLSDTWDWDGANWTQVIPVAAPPGRYAFGMDYDNTAHAFEIFGGYSPNQALNDTWALGLAPQPATGLEATPPAPGAGQVMLSWTASPTPNVSYYVKRGISTGGPYMTIASLGAVTTFTDTGLSSGTYYYVVTAVTGSGGVESANSNEASVSVPAPPTNLTATPNTPSACSVTVSWMASPTGNVTGYNVYHEIPPATTFTEFAGVNSTIMSVVDSNCATMGTTFTYQVTAVGPTGIQSVPSNPATATF